MKSRRSYNIAFLFLRRFFSFVSFVLLDFLGGGTKASERVFRIQDGFPEASLSPGRVVLPGRSAIATQMLPAEPHGVLQAELRV